MEYSPSHNKEPGRKTLVDFLAANNLHVMGYSKPTRGRFSRVELAKHIYTLPDQPDLIPYRTGLLWLTIGASVCRIIYGRR